MITPDASRIGSAVANANRRKKALEKYYNDPKLCEQCSKVIEIRGTESAAETKRRRFCSQSCAASYNLLRRERKPWSEEARQKFSEQQRQKNREKRGYDITSRPRKRIDRVMESEGPCERCGITIDYGTDKSKGRIRIRYVKKRFCDKCLEEVRVENGWNQQRSNGLGYDKPIREMSKKELFEFKNNDPYKFKISVGTLAKRTYQKEHGHSRCVRCDFPAITVSHKRAVADFPDDTLIKDINAPDNLLGLCPNCHWMWDKGYLTEENFHLSNDEILKSVGM